MAAVNGGTYRGIAEDLTFEFRVECTFEGSAEVVSGDIFKEGRFLASFVCQEPQSDNDARSISGSLAFRGHTELVAGGLFLNADPRGIGTFRVEVDLEGGYRDVFAGRLDWQGSFLRRLRIEIDGIAGTKPPLTYTNRSGDTMSMQRAFEQAGFDVSVNLESFGHQTANRRRQRGYTLAEVHAGMTAHREPVPADRLHTHVFVCSYLEGRGNRGVLGVMYDFAENDLNRLPREGVGVFYDHPMLSDPRVPEDARQREYVFTLVHEIGHALNLLHSFDKARPSALSWMNYPHLYPRGYEAGRDHDGTDEFWRQFAERFDDEELRHLRHATPREIRAGGFAFGTYEEGASLPFGGRADPRRTRLGANPLRTTHDLLLSLSPVKDQYDLGEPAFLRVEATNVGGRVVGVPDALDPSEGYLRLFIRMPSGRIVRYQPPVRLCKQAQLVQLPAGETLDPFESMPLFLSAGGPTLTEVGTYEIVAELTGVDGSRNVFSVPTRLVVRAPNAATERLAHELWDRPDVLEALYLRHPLVAREAFGEMEERIEAAALPADNTTASYFNYVSALGWMSPFAPPTAREKDSNLDKARERLAKVNPQGLPRPVADRRRSVVVTDEASMVTRGDRRQIAVVVTRPMEQLRAEVPPSGLFGSVGLDPAPDATPDPFERVVPRLRGTTRFCDVVSWNIEHLHSPANFRKIPRIAELIRSFRCDFWGLQEVDATSLERLVTTLNSSGRTRYSSVVVGSAGQQSGALFRTDTTSVRVLPAASGLFDEKLEVTLTKGSKKVTRPVFHREPLLCDVRVRQEQAGAFDFRCAIVHLKSTDSQLADKGNSLRSAAAEALLRWLETDREAGSELDYLIMGDYNAETAEQGLSPFAAKEDLRLLSVGMQDRHGKGEALTRVASKRLLDHIVVTADAFTAMPKEDEDEQLIVRADSRIGDWTDEFSDHVPVAVRFVIAEDED